jgi:hypothetical protein
MPRGCMYGLRRRSYCRPRHVMRFSQGHKERHTDREACVGTDVKYSDKVILLTDMSVSKCELYKKMSKCTE